MKKNKLFIALALVLTLSFALAGCDLFRTETPAPIIYNLSYAESDDYLIGVANNALKSMVEIKTETSSGNSAGSGVIIAADSSSNRTYIITNNHVVMGESYTGSGVYTRNATSVGVKLSVGGSTYVPATVLKNSGADNTSDLAIISIPYSSSHTAAVYADEELKYGQHVLAVGNGLDYGTSVCDGIISNPSITINTTSFKNTVIQHSAAINSGNSGGGIFDMHANLVGVNTLKAVISGSGKSTIFADGISFALKMSQVKDFVDEYNRGATKTIQMTEYIAQ